MFSKLPPLIIREREVDLVAQRAGCGVDGLPQISRPDVEMGTTSFDTRARLETFAGAAPASHRLTGVAVSELSCNSRSTRSLLEV